MGKAALDYLRLATWDINEHVFLLSDILSQSPGEFEPAKWLQYHGWKRDGVFIGTGEQKGKRHSVVDISGYCAEHNYQNFLHFDSYYSTRIDLQVTIPKPDGIELSEVYKDLKDAKVKTSIIQSEINDTLYVGARTSPVFTRLYEKPLDEMYLRLEFEFKGKVAKAIWKALRAESTMDEIYQHYLKRSKLPLYITKLFYNAQDGETEFAIRKEIAHSDAKKLAWLQSCDSSVRQALYNHNIGTEVQALVMTWAAEAANVDIIKEMN
jgi:hypothetical protein